MRLDHSQQLKMSQEMKLSPRIIQAMEILQLPIYALESRIESELQSNPALEIQDGNDANTNIDDDPKDRGEESLVVRDESNNSDDFERLDTMSSEYGEDSFSEASPMSYSGSNGDVNSKMEAMANTAGPEESLTENLHNQLTFLNIDDVVCQIGHELIDSITEDGYLRTPLEQIIETMNPVPSMEDALEALAVLHSLEPIGVGARDLRECLLLQLATKVGEGFDMSLETQLVTSFLREIEMNHLPLIAKRTDHDIEDIKEAIKNISFLDPRPGMQLGQNASPVIYPDVSVTKHDDGNIYVTVGDERYPSLAISDYCIEKSRDKSETSASRSFLKKNIRSGQWIIEAIAQRKQTLRRVTEEVFRVQEDFLEQGRESLKPLPMADIAEKVGVHVATISRAVADKYVQTEQGIFPLRMFFSGGTKTQAGEDMSWQAVKLKLKEMIDNEDKSKPLNDEKLAQAIKETGIKISRRTVAKYRKILEIPPARKRKEY